MGWSSGGEVFDPVARALLDAEVKPDVLRSVLRTLIEQLQERGWDTEGESIEQFASEPAVVAAFADCGVRLDDDEDDGN